MENETKVNETEVSKEEVKEEVKAEEKAVETEAKTEETKAEETKTEETKPAEGKDTKKTAAIVGGAVGGVIVVAAYVCLLGIEQAQRERVGAVAAKPGLQERYAVGLVELSVGLCADGECLAVTLRKQETVIVALGKQVAHAEVGELESGTSYHTGLTPTERNLNLVVTL